MPIFFVEVLNCAAERFDRLYTAVSDFLDKDCGGIPGFRGAELLYDEDRRKIILVTEWETREAWCVAQWNAKVGKLAEVLALGATTLDYSLCYRR
jgi:heme-degrading monooxygenase HmoA